MKANGPPAPRPPRWAQKLLRELHPADTLEEVEGDLAELYAYWYQREGARKANRRYAWSVASVLPPLLRRRSRTQEYHRQPTHWPMMRWFFTQLGRRLVKERTYSLLNVAGLSAGLVCFAFIALWVTDELSYDRFHQQEERLVRLTTTQKTPSGLVASARTAAPLAKALRDNYEEIENTVRLERKGEIVQYNNKQTLENDILLADSSFFSVFSYRLLRGNPQTALQDPYSVVLTESAAKKYFGRADPIGQTILMYLYDSTGRGAPYTVTGIAADPPPNAHFTFSILGSFKTVEAARPSLATAEGWTDNRYYTYMLLRPGVNYQDFSGKMARFLPAYANRQLAGAAYSFGVQSIRSIHLHSHLEGEIAPNGSSSQVYLFSTIGLLILLLAGINYTNLATARSTSRAREVSIKKVVGATPFQLLIQYLAESVCVALLALGLAGLLSVFLQPFFVQLTGKTRSLLATPSLLLLLAGITILLGLLSGVYPAFVLSRFKPASVLKGAFQSAAKGIALRQSLIVFQFLITLLLITSIVIIYSQMNYIRHKDLGFAKDALVFVRLNGNAEVIKGYNAFKADLQASTLIGGVATSRSGITHGLETTSATALDGRGKPVEVTAAKLEVDTDYLATYGIQLLAGRHFTPRAAGDTLQQIVLNGKAVQKLGWKSPGKALGKPFTMDNRSGIVVGVVRDFHYHSLQHTIEPLAMVLRDAYFSRITIRISGNDMGRSLAFIEQVWRKHFPVALFDYDFVDHLLAGQYQAQERFSTLMLYCSALSLVIACLGVYGLMAYSTASKTKEIGIRKTLGASAASIVVLLSREFFKLVVLACLLALPLAWYLMRQWLEDFAYRIVLQWWMFGASVVLVLGVAFLTVSVQTLRAALDNPVKSLRSE